MNTQKLPNPLDSIPDDKLKRYQFIIMLLCKKTKEEAIHCTAKYFSISSEQATEDVEFAKNNFIVHECGQV